MAAVRARGFTLLEVVVALALLAGVVLLAARMLAATRRMEASASVVAAGPRLGVLGAQLRRDLESAVGAPGSGGRWSALALPLVLADGSAVSYDFDGEALRRTVLVPDGTTRSRVLVRGLRSFRWRGVHHRAVDVKVSFPVPELAERRTAADRGRTTTWWIRVAPRGAGWARRW